MLYKGNNLYLNWLEDGIAELVFDAPGSVNKRYRHRRQPRRSAGRAGEANRSKGLLLRSEKAAFIVGADITEFLSLFQFLRSS